MRKLKILFSAPHSGLQTGSGVQLYLLARELVRRGHQVSAVFKNKADGAEPPDPTLAKLAAAGVEVIRVPFAKLKYGFTLPALAELGAYLFERDFDIVHCFAGMDLNYFYLLSSFAPLGAIVSNRGTFESLDVFNSIKYRTGRVRKIIAVSAAVKDSLMKSGWVPEEKIEVCYSAVDLSVFDSGLDGGPVRSELGLPPGDPVIGAIGSFRFTPGHLKGGMELLRAARLILDQHPQTRFLLAGTINRELFIEAAAPLGIADRFTLAGFREDVPRVLAACDLTLVPSLFAEGLNGTIREALAMQKPVVATDVGGNRELVINHITGRLVPPGDPEALAAAAGELLERPELRAALGAAGRKKVEACCSLAAKVDKIEAIYAQCLSSQPRPRKPRAWQKALHRIHRASSPLFQNGPRYLQGWRPAPAPLPSRPEPAPAGEPLAWSDKIKHGLPFNLVLFILAAVVLGFWGWINLEYLLPRAQVRNFSGEVAAWNRSPNPREFRLAIIGDSQGNPEALEARIEETRPAADAVVIMGDLVDHASRLKFLFARMELAEGAGNLPVFTVMGNHDLGPRRQGNLFRRTFGPDHYWLRFGRVLFLTLNNVEPGLWPEQMEWLDHALAQPGPPAEKIFLLMHRPPPVRAGTNGMSPEQGRELRRRLEPYAGKLAILAGHLRPAAARDWEGIPVYGVGEAAAQESRSPSAGYLALICSPSDCRMVRRAGGSLARRRWEEKVMVDAFWAHPMVGIFGMVPWLWTRIRRRKNWPLPARRKSKYNQ